METLIPSEPSFYDLGGDKIFHDETRVWQMVLGHVPTDANPEDMPEWYAWWSSLPDYSVKPDSFDQPPPFTLEDAVLKPRFASMNKVNLAYWLRVRGFNVPSDLKKVTKAQLVNRAERVWDDQL